MGWTYIHREPGMSDQALFEREFPATLGGSILASATVGDTFYAAVQDRESGRVRAFVTITKHVPGHRNFGYKDPDETMGPYEARCPAQVLYLLSPLPGCDHPPLGEAGYCGTCCARDWRRRCREAATAAEWARAQAELARYVARARARAVKPGMAVKFAEPVDFGDGRVHDTLTLVQRSTFRGPDGRLYKVPNWRTRCAWEVAR